ncbi:MAG TPA: gamma-glutamyl-gamma-aminobutyrate hydrolase family protein [Candidatus Acidoferrum sp.]|nr:gamma-glutamyl-gamma-aminobutyrate hydrolase family protein [Candidatus Acidoferrum sp.]
MARPPLIGVTMSTTPDGGQTNTPPRAWVNHAYFRAVLDAGGIPILLPPHLDGRALEQLWARLDGILLTGGGDVDPAHFGEDQHPTVADVSEARDRLEIAVTERAMHDRRPLLAICRGIQVLNVALGGSLHQDIASDTGSTIAHSQTAPRDQPTHLVKVMGEGTRLGATLGAPEIAVNSMHHQALKRLGSGLRDVAWAPDGIIEGVEIADGTALVLGVQWHPEELVAHDPAARNLFRTLVAAAEMHRR